MTPLILVIEDVPAVLLSMRIVLEGAGYQVVGAGDGEQGLALMCAHAFDLVITDIWMPGASGTRVISQGRAILPHARFLAITGGDPNGPGGGDTLRRTDFGADHLLLKPFEKTDLLAIVDGLLAVRTVPVAALVS